MDFGPRHASIVPAHVARFGRGFDTHLPSTQSQLEQKPIAPAQAGGGDSQRLLATGRWGGALVAGLVVESIVVLFSRFGST